MSRGQFYCNTCHEYLEPNLVNNCKCYICNYPVEWKEIPNMFIMDGVLSCIFCGADQSGLPKGVEFAFCWYCGNRSCTES